MQRDTKKLEKVVGALKRRSRTINEIMKIGGISKETAHRWIRIISKEFGYNISKTINRPIQYYIEENQ